MQCVVRSEAFAVRGRLEALGLDESILRDAVRRGYLAYIGCTANHPPAMPGYLAWGETVCGLRELLAPRAWTRSNESNYSVVVSPAGTLAIAVATGDEGTGMVDHSPTTKAWKGPSTRDAVSYNQLQLGLELPEQDVVLPLATLDGVDRITWILLAHRAAREVRCELSLPSDFVDGYISQWHERILLAPVLIDEDPVELTLPTMPDIDINISRKA